MRRVALGKTGLEVSAVGFGGIPIQRVSEEDAVRAIRRALDLGVDFIDTAAGYSDSQRKIGAALEGRKERVVLASKSGQVTKEGILADIGRARVEMRADVIDIYQLHGVNSPERRDRMLAPGGALEGLIEARERGLIAHIGFSSHSLDVSLDLVENHVFESVQFAFNLVTSEAKDGLIPKALGRGLGFIVMKPLCGGEYDDAVLAFKFLNSYPELVPIPGIERAREIEEIVGIVESGAVLDGGDRSRAERIAAELGKRFCRRCGYCQPCPNGVPLVTAMVFESFVRRMPRERLVAAFAKPVAERGPNCVECGECEKKCPYGLPVIETVKAAVEKAKAIFEE